MADGQGMDGKKGDWLRAPRPVRPLSERVVRKAATLLCANPAFDPVALGAMRRVIFPLSRLWAAAEASHGDLNAFYDHVPMEGRLENRARLARALDVLERRRIVAKAVDGAWHAGFFGGEDRSPSALSALEAERRHTKHLWNMAREAFLPLLSKRVPRANMQPVGPAEMARIHGAALDDPARLYALPAAMPVISQSRVIPGFHGTDSWLSFDSPSPRTGDRVFARVHQPDGVDNPPTVIFGHGICIEFDHWQGLVDEADALAAAGYRVIRPEAPWHGRRRPLGHYSGEKIIATFPLGLVDALSAAAMEWAVLAQWARATSSGPLAFAGTSFGALTAQLAASLAHDWPAQLRPDALLLITHCASIGDAVVDGALATMWGSREEAEALGWDMPGLARYLALVDPVRGPCVPAERIVTVLGERDNVTPFASGLALVDRWMVPAENRFIWNRGHFSVPLSMARNGAPLARFGAIMEALAKR